MRVDARVVLDACVLLPMPLANTLFRMAEEPRLYVPYWTDQIMEEVSRNLVSKFGTTPQQARHREEQIRNSFPSAWVDDGYKLLIPSMQTDPKDRHVLAAAIQSRSELIVTFNIKHFPAAALDSFGVTCEGPSAFLKELYVLEPSIVTRKLMEQAKTLGIALKDLLAKLKKSVPGFVDSYAKN